MKTHTNGNHIFEGEGKESKLLAKVIVIDKDELTPKIHRTRDEAIIKAERIVKALNLLDYLETTDCETVSVKLLLESESLTRPI